MGQNERRVIMSALALAAAQPLSHLGNLSVVDAQSTGLCELLSRLVAATGKPRQIDSPAVFDHCQRQVAPIGTEASRDDAVIRPRSGIAAPNLSAADERAQMLTRGAAVGRIHLGGIDPV